MGIPKFPGFFESSLIDEGQKPTDKKSDKKLKKKSKRKSTLFEISFDVTIKKPY